MPAFARRNRPFSSLLLNLALEKASLSLLLLVVACTAIQTPCSAQPFWVNPSGGIYETGSNWVPNGIPAPGNTITFGQPGPYDVSFLSDETAGGLLISNNAEVSYTAGGLAGSPDRTFTVAGDATIDNGKLTLKTPGNNKLNLTIDGDLIAPNGDLKVLGGATLQLGEMIIDDGEVVIDGVGPNGSPSTISATEDIELGRYGYGILRIGNGAEFLTRGVTLGPFGFGWGSVQLVGQDALGNPSRWDAPLGLLVDHGNVAISGGAHFTSGATSVSTGSINVTDPDSSWITPEVYCNGVGEDSRIRVIKGGHVSSETVFLGSFGSNMGSIILSSTDPDALSTWNNSGDMFVGGNQDRARSDGLLQLVGNSRVEVAGTIKIWATGAVRLSTPSTLVADTILNDEGGEFGFYGGRLHVNRFEGDLVSSSGTLSPGPEVGATIINGDYTQGIDGTLAIDIGGLSPGGTHDLVSLVGNADLNGQLELSLINGFVPAASNTFTVSQQTVS